MTPCRPWWLLLLGLLVLGALPGGAGALWRHAARAPAAGVQRGRRLQQSASCAAVAPGCEECACSSTGSCRCTRCGGSLLVLKDGSCGCPAGRFNDGQRLSCRDCPKGSFCPGGVHTGEAGTPSAVSCSAAFGEGLTTLGVRSISKQLCVNEPGFAYNVDSVTRDPSAQKCGQDSYSPGLRKQRACVSCPAGMRTFGVQGASAMRSCDWDGCIATAPCHKSALCRDQPKPALGGVDGRTCFCPPGQSFRNSNSSLDCIDSAKTELVGGAFDDGRLADFEMRCPPGALVVAVAGRASLRLDAIGPITCSDGTVTPAKPAGNAAGGTEFVTRLSAEGFSGLQLRVADLISSVSLLHFDGTSSAEYGGSTSGALMDAPLKCPGGGVVVGLFGHAIAAGPVQLGLICQSASSPCGWLDNYTFGPAQPRPEAPAAPSAWLSPSAPRVLATASPAECCNACTQDWTCVYWVRQPAASGACWLVTREPFSDGVPMPASWAYTPADGFQAGPSRNKPSGIATSSAYAGCFLDIACPNENNALSVLSASSAAMNVDKCAVLAREGGFLYFALKPGATARTTSCLGTDELPSVPKPTGCFAACSGASQRCGDATCGMSMYAAIKPRWPLSALDTGDATRTRGFFDISCQGAANDYCRYTGSGSAAHWSCALAGAESSETPAGVFTENATLTTPCEEPGYQAQPLADLACGTLATPVENGCNTRQCCRKLCDTVGNRCAGFSWGNSPNDDCGRGRRGDGQNCCWLKSAGVDPNNGTALPCGTVAHPTLTAWWKADPVNCPSAPPDPPNGMFLCPGTGPGLGLYRYGITCTALCFWPNATIPAPTVTCLKSGSWSAVSGECPPRCTGPFCPI